MTMLQSQDSRETEFIQEDIFTLMLQESRQNLFDAKYEIFSLKKDLQFWKEEAESWKKLYEHTHNAVNEFYKGNYERY